MKKIEFTGLREFIDKMDELGHVKRVEGADPNLEVGAITEFTFKKLKDRCPLILFDRLKDHPSGFRIAVHVVSTPRRMAYALGLDPEINKIEMVRQLKDKIKLLQPVKPIEVSDGPVLENVLERDNINMKMFPAPKWHYLDGGPYIGTGCVQITADPDDGWVNCGVYRVMLHDERTLGHYASPGKHVRIIRERWWSKGKSMPIVVVFGPDPRLFIAGAQMWPTGISELDVAGYYAGKPFKVIRGKYTNLPIPADAEIAIEGEVPPLEVEGRPEGPFGEFTGYYASGERLESIIKVKAIYYRNDPILYGAPPLPPLSTGSCGLGLPAGAPLLWASLEQLGIPGLKGVWSHWDYGGFYVISIKQMYAGHASQVAHAALATRAAGYATTWIIIVDDDIDPSNMDEVWWAMLTRRSPKDAIEFVSEGWSTLLDPTVTPDKRGRGDISNTKAIVLACKPFYYIKDFPQVNVFPPEEIKKYIEKWGGLFGIEPS
jgi:4-hydroxy-3-polyprenylbenzoate decarboxylase